jgi:membrane fusion protein (multidrug efflux system)
VQPGEQLLSIVPVDDIWITADFRETHLRRMHRGQPVTVHVDTTGRDYLMNAASETTAAIIQGLT